MASTPAEVISSCSITFGMLADPAAALAVVEGESGIASAITSGKSYVDVSTVDEQTSQKINELITAAGGRFLEVSLPCPYNYKPRINPANPSMSLRRVLS